MDERSVPQGLIITRDAAPQAIKSFEHVDVDHIRVLWQTYSACKHALPAGVGIRLENFFWRLWSTQARLRLLSGLEVARQFSRINEGGDIRTTPTGSPRVNSGLSNVVDSNPPAIAPSRPGTHDKHDQEAIDLKSQIKPLEVRDANGGGLNILSRPICTHNSIASTVTSQGSPQPKNGTISTIIYKSDIEPSHRQEPFRSNGIQQLQPILKKSLSISSRHSNKSAAFEIPPSVGQLSRQHTEDDDCAVLFEDFTPPRRIHGVNGPRRLSTRFEGEVTIIPTQSSPQVTRVALQAPAMARSSSQQSSLGFMDGASPNSRNLSQTQVRSSRGNKSHKCNLHSTQKTSEQQDEVDASDQKDNTLRMVQSARAGNSRGVSVHDDRILASSEITTSLPFQPKEPKALMHRSFTDLTSLSAATAVKAKPVIGSAESYNVSGLLDLKNVISEVTPLQLQPPIAQITTGIFAAKTHRSPPFGSPSKELYLRSDDVDHAEDESWESRNESSTSSSPPLQILSSSLPRTKSHTQLSVLLQNSDRVSAAEIAGIRYRPPL